MKGLLSSIQTSIRRRFPSAWPHQRIFELTHEHQILCGDSFVTLSKANRDIYEVGRTKSSGCDFIQWIELHARCSGRRIAQKDTIEDIIRNSPEKLPFSEKSGRIVCLNGDDVYLTEVMPDHSVPSGRSIRFRKTDRCGADFRGCLFALQKHEKSALA